MLVEFESYGFYEDLDSLIKSIRLMFSISLDVFLSHALLLIILLIPL